MNRRIASAGHGVVARGALAAVVCLSGFVGVTGCGGGGNGAAVSSSPAAGDALTVAVKWPQQRAATVGAHLIPDDSQSITLELTTQAGALVASTCLVRPSGGAGGATSSYTFTNVPAGALTVGAAAHADEACSDRPAQATGMAPVTVQPGVNQSVTITMVGTVTSVSVSPSPATVFTGGAPVTLTGSALDSAGETVLTAPGDWTWACSPAGAVAPSSGSGPTASLTAAEPGQTVCTFTVTQGTGATPVTGTATVSAETYTLTTLASFNGTNGANPQAGLIADGQANFYGTTAEGGSGYNAATGGLGDGTIFRWNAGSGITTLANFTGTNGANPDASLITDGQGNFYGTTPAGGSTGYDVGTVFEYNSASGIDVLATFTYQFGEPRGGLTTDGSGNFYGTTVSGGSDGLGTVFEYVANTASLSALAGFNNANGALPDAGLITDGQGNFYGTAPEGGTGAIGAVFKYNSSGITLLASLDGTNGAGPVASLVTDGQGNFYGTASAGGNGFTGVSNSGYGTIFKWNANAGLTVVASFDGANGTHPESALIADGQGNYYGTTMGGGAAGAGTVFCWNAASGITTLASFNGANGTFPLASLLADGQGNFYGTTSEGGAYGYGTIFELSPTTVQGAVRGSAMARRVSGMR